MIEDKLAQAGLSPPAASKPAFAYVPVTLDDGVAYVSGQLPKIDGEGKVFGKPPFAPPPAIHIENPLLL